MKLLANTTVSHKIEVDAIITNIQQFKQKFFSIGLHHPNGLLHSSGT